MRGGVGSGGWASVLNGWWRAGAVVAVMLAAAGASAAMAATAQPTAHGRIRALSASAIDAAVTSSTGDPELADVIANPPAAQPTTIPPGTSATIHVTFTPAGAPGQTVRGELFLDNLQSAFGSADELAAIPYAYKTS